MARQNKHHFVMQGLSLFFFFRLYQVEFYLKRFSFILLKGEQNLVKEQSKTIEIKQIWLWCAYVIYIYGKL